MSPVWLEGDVRPAARNEWLTHWAGHGKARPETRELAASFTAKGFDHQTGKQWHAKSYSAIAEDAGVSASSAKRFLARGKEQGYLSATGEKRQLVAGKRATKLYRLTIPLPTFHGAPFAANVPPAFMEELRGLVELDERLEAQKAWPAPWDSGPTGPVPF